MTEAQAAVTDNTPPPAAAGKETATETKTVYDGSAIRSARKEEAAPKAEPAARTQDKPAGYDPVDFKTATTEEIQQRHDYLYRQVKEGGRTLSEYRKIASDQAKQIEELTKGFNGVVTHLQGKSLDDSEEALTSQMNTAFERGDNKAYLDAQKKLINLGVQKQLHAERQTAKPAAPEKPAPQAPARSGDGEGMLSDTEFRAMEAWQNEKDENGNFLRPWSKTSDTENPDPKFKDALAEANAVLTGRRFAGWPLEQKLEEIDKRMGMAKRVNAQTVTGGGLTGRGKTTKVALSPDIEKMVRQTKWGGSKYKSDDERLDAYRNQLATVRNSQKGTRQ